MTIGGIALSTTPLSIKEWMISIFLGALCMPVAVLLRLLPDDVVASAFGLPRAWQTWFRKRSPSTTPSNATWLSTVDHIRCELVTCTQPRSSRLRRLIRNSSRGWGWSSSGVESERGHSDNERTPLLQNRDADAIGSRRGSVCAPSVVMAGMVAGGVGGLPRVEPHNDA